MPHYKDGTLARVLDRVKLCTGSTARDGKTELVYGEGVVLEIVPGATCCELKVFVPNGPLELLGSGTAYQMRPPPDNALGAPIMHHLGFAQVGPGYVTQTNAKECEIVERVKDAPAAAVCCATPEAEAAAAAADARVGTRG